MNYLLFILFGKKLRQNAMIKVQSSSRACFGSSYPLPRLLGRGFRFDSAILASDGGDCPKIDLAKACEVDALAFPNLWNLVGVVYGDVWTCLGWSWSLAIACTLIKEFDWRFLLFFVVLTMKFVSFCDSFFIVNEMTQKQFQDLLLMSKTRGSNFFASIDCWRQ